VNIRFCSTSTEPAIESRDRQPAVGCADTIGEHPILFSAQQTENREWRALFNERTATLAEITPAALLR
jgi:hypothetical protein